jgi:hypothetical protein
MSGYSTVWKRDLEGSGCLVMEQSAAGYCAVLVGFRGFGSTQEEALDDLLVCMKRYCEEADDFKRSVAPGGQLHEKLGQLRLLVDQVVREHQS